MFSDADPVGPEARDPQHSGSTHTEPVEAADSEFASIDLAARAYADASDTLRRALRDDLVHQAAPVARRLARRYRGRGEALEDLEQVALVGLMKAIDGYDPDRGPFSGYFMATVSGELKKHFRDRGWSVRVPRRLQELVAQVVQTSARLTTDKACRPTTADLAAELRVSEGEIAEALGSASAYRPTSLNAALPGDDGAELGDTLGDLDTELRRVEDRLTVSELLCRLPARERRILAMRFYGNCTQTEIAEALGISQMHASRLLSQALGWLRDALLSDDPLQWKAGRGASADGPRLGIRTAVVSGGVAGGTPTSGGVTRAGGAVVVEVRGELERDTADQLRRALSAALRLGPARQLRVDLRAVPFIDAAAISALIGAGEQARRAGMRLSLVGARRHVAQALATAGLWPFLDHDQRERDAPATRVNGTA